MKPVLLTAAGNAENQDCGDVLHYGPRSVICVCDGAGGISGGRKAASMAVGYVRSFLQITKDAVSCVQLLKHIDKVVCHDQVAGETTGVILAITRDAILGASCGDSGAWFFPTTGNPVHLTQFQQKRPFIGSGQAQPVPFNHMRCPGKVLVATDGLLKFASIEKIAAICHATSLDAAPAKLIDLVHYPSGNLPDDVTVAVGDV